MSNYKFYIISLILTFYFNNIIGQSGNKSLDKFFQRKIEKANIAGLQAAFISNGQLKWIGSYGLRDYTKNLAVNDSTLFLIASCSKPVTALGILKLYDEGKIDLDENINKYLPFKIYNPNFKAQPITIRMLLSHTSSLSDNTPLLVSLYTFETGGDSPISLEDFIKGYFTPEGKYYNKKKNFGVQKPGESKAYCNAGYALLGYLIERITGSPFNRYIQQEIFEPLHMKNSFWFLKNIPHNNISLPHEFSSQKNAFSLYQVKKHYGFPDYPDGQLRTNVTDYSKFLELILNKGKVDETVFISESVMKEFLEIQFVEADEHQAIAWNYNEFNNWLYYLFMPRLPSHTGVDPGVATVTSFDPETGHAAIIFANTLTHNFKGHKILYLDMVKRLLKEAKRSD